MIKQQINKNYNFYIYKLISKNKYKIKNIYDQAANQSKI